MRALPLILASACPAALPAHAQDADDSPWDAEISLSGSRTTGNTSTTDIGAGLQVGYLGEKWEHSFRGSAEFGTEDGDTVKKLIRTSLQSSREITERLYGYGNAEYFQDNEGAYKFGYFAGGGLGYRVAMAEPVSWAVEAGPGYRIQKTRNSFGDPSGVAFEREEEIAVRANSDFQWQVNDRVEIYNLSEVIHSAADTYLWNEAGVTADLLGDMALRASFRVDHHTDVPDGRSRTDTITRFGVVYSFD